MKACSKCGVNERLGRRTICRDCFNAYRRTKKKEYIHHSRKYKKNNRELVNQQRKDRYHKLKDGKWRVYILPNADDYVGYTGIPLNERMNRHRYVGNDPTNYRVLMELDTEEDAKELESLLHDMGYPGK
tara:strand:- start:1257 stop:1643 length:387 start_codon:yes stop_codon:yes gene_type:complete